MARLPLFTAALVGAAGLFVSCSGERGAPGEPGAPGPAMPVIQSLDATGPVAPGARVTARVTAQSAEGLALSYEWSVSEGWAIAGSATGTTVEIVAPGVYGASGIATVRVTDEQRRVATGAIALSTELNLAPVIGSITAFPNPVRRGEPVTLEVSAFDLRGDDLTYSWSVPEGWAILAGQGTPRVTAVATAFASGTARVTVTDHAGGATEAAVFVATQDGSFGPVPALLDGYDGGNSLAPVVAANATGEAIAVVTRPYLSGWAVYARRFNGSSWTSLTVFDGTADGYDPAKVAIDADGDVLLVFVRPEPTADGTTRKRVHAVRYDADADAWGAVERIDSDTDLLSARKPAIAMDAAGNAVVVWSTQEEVWMNRFDAATGTWAAAEPIAETPERSFDARVAVGAAGQGVVTWWEKDGSAWGVVLSIDAGVSGSRYRLDTGIPDPGILPYPDVAADALGNAIVIWTQPDGGYPSIFARRYLASSATWGPAVAIETLSGDAYSPDLGMDAGGNALVAWSHAESGARRIRVSRFSAATNTWTVPAVLLDSATSAFVPQVAVDPTGAAVISWIHREPDTTELVWASRSAGPAEPWEHAPVSRSGQDVDGTAVAMGSAANAVVVWRFIGPSHHDLFGRNWTAAGGWSFSPTVVDAGPGRQADAPHVAANGGDDVIAVWQQLDGRYTGIHARRRDGANGLWEPPVPLSRHRLGDASEPRVALDPAGNAVAVWLEQLTPSSCNRVLASRYDAGTRSWSGPVALERGACSAQPQVAMDAAGNAIAVWSADGGVAPVRWARYHAAARAWSAASTVEGTGRAQHLRLASSGSGRAVAVWLDGAKQQERTVRASRFDPSTGTFVPAANVGTFAGRAYDEPPDVAVDEAGVATVVWSGSDEGTVSSAYASRFQADTGTWEAPRPLEASLLETGAVHVGVDARGDVTAVFSQSDGIQSSSWATRYGAATASWTPPRRIESLGIHTVTDLVVDPAGNALAFLRREDGTGRFDAARYFAGGADWAGVTPFPGSPFPPGPVVAVDGSGTGVAVWIESSAEGSFLWWNRFE